MPNDKSETTKREEAIARLLCGMWDDDWKWGKKFHTDNAKQIIKLSDKMRRKST